MRKIKLKVNEIFYSIQGEGANTGMPAIFIRLSGCNMSCSFCDTSHQNYTEMSIGQIMNELIKYPCRIIVWTGGEPTLQLTNEILSHFSIYHHCIETNGTNPVPTRINYISCSPKVEIEVLHKNFSRINEIRYPIKEGDVLPDWQTLPKATHYFVSPIDVSKSNLDYCLKLIKENRQWKLSVQLHKVLKIK